jgi:hypothetical protein
MLHAQPPAPNDGLAAEYLRVVRDSLEKFGFVHLWSPRFSIANDNGATKRRLVVHAGSLVTMQGVPHGEIAETFRVTKLSDAIRSERFLEMSC